ncbi:MAG: hypothetical protein JO166_11935 [Deltaproteobacteria bacterium]|nr:hypothetical protein [Deltaproteobacteria bacterium]
MRSGGPFQEWDQFDFLAVTGMLAVTGSIVASFFPRLRKIQLLFPIAIGTAMMVVAGYGARYAGGEMLSEDGNEPDATASVISGA